MSYYFHRVLPSQGNPQIRNYGSNDHCLYFALSFQIVFSNLVMNVVNGLVGVIIVPNTII